MRVLPAGLIATALMLSPASFAQVSDNTPTVGSTVFAFDMVADRVVIFEPVEDGKVRILKVDSGRQAPVPRNPGQVAAAMTYAPEIGTVIEFNSGLAHDFVYQALSVSHGDTPGKMMMQPLPTCSVNGDAVASERWPQRLASVTLSGFKRHDGAPTC